LNQYGVSHFPLEPSFSLLGFAQGETFFPVLVIGIELILWFPGVLYAFRFLGHDTDVVELDMGTHVCCALPQLICLVVLTLDPGLT